MLRTIWVYAVGITVTPVLATYAILVSFLGRSKVACRCSAIARLWGRCLMRATGSTVTVEGLERFDPTEPHIMIANHQSWFDVFALIGWFPGDFRFVAKEELRRIPIFGLSWQRCGHISIDRADRSAAIGSLDRASERIKREGLTIVMFPEGTRSPDGQLQPFKKGAFVLAISSGVPILPVSIHGTRRIMAKGRWRIGKADVSVRVGTPLDTLMYGLEGRDRLRGDAWMALRELLDRDAGSSDAGAHVTERKVDVGNR